MPPLKISVNEATEVCKESKYFTCLHMSHLISRKIKSGNIYYNIDSRRPDRSLDESSLHKNPYFDSSYAQVVSEIRILFTLYDSKMTPDSRMRLQKFFYVIFGLGGKRILKVNSNFRTGDTQLGLIFC